jgi:hypothetical protein
LLIFCYAVHHEGLALVTWLGGRAADGTFPR